MDNINSNENTVIACEERKLLALEATWEIEQLSILIIEISDKLDAETLAFRGLGARIKELNSTIMSAIGDENMENNELYMEIHKRPHPDNLKDI